MISLSPARFIYLISLAFLTLAIVCCSIPLRALFATFVIRKDAQIPLVSSIQKARDFCQTKIHASWVFLGLFLVFLPLGAVDSYIARQSPIAKAGVLANIGPSGARSSDAKSGVVIASPSTSDPDYLYTWTRDASLVFKGIIDQYTLEQNDPEAGTLRGLIDDFVGAQAVLQQVPNPSGNVSTDGLGEPKFHISLTAFTEDWGRPQRDGPALRSIALITYADWLVANANPSHVTSEIWPIVKLDLDYVANKWNITGFDLWEEVSSSSFFTSAVQHRALRQGVALAEKIGQTDVIGGWTTQANNILCFMQSYWNSDGLYITSNMHGGRSGKDANSVLVSIHTFDAAAGCDAVTFQPCSDKALANLKAYVDAFRSIYTLNKNIPHNAAVATGRYPEDVYYGGNPWYLTTSAVAEQLYDALIVWKLESCLEVTNISLAFFQQFSPSVVVGTYRSSSTTYTALVKAIRDYADGFLAVNAKYTPADGSMAEQYGREDGAPLSAKHLTWSYASALSAFAARSGTSPASWGAKGLKVPAVCESNTMPMVKATFHVVAETVWGENIYLTGSIDQLRNWSPDQAILLSPTEYPTWSVSLDVPASTSFEFKYIREHHGVVTWEDGANRHATTPATGSLEVNDTWR